MARPLDPTSKVADELQTKHRLPQGEPAVAVSSRALINRNNIVILDPGAVATAAELLTQMGFGAAGAALAATATFSVARGLIAGQDSASSSASTLVVSFAAENLYQRRSQAAGTHGTLTFSSSNRAAQKQQVIFVTETSGNALTLAFPADWKWVGFKPTTLTASTTGVLSLICFGTAETDVFASWSA